jgi:hypothetical protein
MASTCGSILFWVWRSSSKWEKPKRASVRQFQAAIHRSFAPKAFDHTRLWKKGPEVLTQQIRGGLTPIIGMSVSHEWAMDWKPAFDVDD